MRAMAILYISFRVPHERRTPPKAEKLVLDSQSRSTVGFDPCNSTSTLNPVTRNRKHEIDLHITWLARTEMVLLARENTTFVNDT